jgi:hydroxymethylpyrimidine pyrophosphatase-like HAD family hydrolase
LPDAPPIPAPLPALGESPIRLIVADIDGCLSGGAGAPFDMRLLEALAWANRESRTNPAVPAVTLCTGRPQPYVECLLQVIGGHVPALCESGTVFFDPQSHSILTHPGFGLEEEKALEDLRNRVAHAMMKDNIKPEPGKVTHLTVIVQPPDTPEALYDQAVEIAAEFGNMFVVELTRICVHFLFRHLHKGTGVQWLSQHTGIPLQQMAGIGDAAPDLPFLTQVGYAFAPANAQPEVKSACHKVSLKNDAEAAFELFQSIMDHNTYLIDTARASEEETTG